MSIINEIFGCILETLSSIHLYFYDNITMAFLITLWILFFRNKLKSNMALTVAGLLLAHAVALIANDLVYRFIINGFEPPIWDIMSDIWRYFSFILWFMVFKAFVREEWSKALLVYCVSTTVVTMSDHASFLVEAGFSAVGLPVLSNLSYPASLVSYVAILIIFGIAQYRLLSPRLERLESRDIKWLWAGHAAFYVIYDIGLTFFVEIYCRGNNVRIDPQDPVFLFFVAQLVILFILVFALTLVILDNISQNKRLSSEGVLKDQLIDMQREQYKRFMENAEAEKAYRHDLRHQFAVIRQYNESGEPDKLSEYLDRLTGGLPASEKIYCKNYAANAIASHYIAMAESEGVTVETRLDIPENAGDIPDMDLCVIMGNLLENAVEACRRAKEDECFITLNASIRNNTLIITMDNSFDGVYAEADGVFYSRKRDGEGTGLSSVRAVARKYGGDARFEAKGKMFMSSVYVDMRELETVPARMGDEGGVKAERLKG